MSEASNWLLDLVFPRYCLGCGQLLHDLAGRQVCRLCLADVVLKKEFACAFCSAPVMAGRTCPFCIRDGYHLDRLLVAANYDQPLAEGMLKAMKYRFVRSLADELAGLMIKYLETMSATGLIFSSSPPVLVPVPLHQRRLNWRGFNQSELLAEKIAAHFGWPLNCETLKRVKHQSPQADSKSRTERIERMKGMFACDQPAAVSGRTILLVDDIATTASTLDDCARALKEGARRPDGQAGATEVIALVFARGK